MSVELVLLVPGLLGPEGSADPGVARALVEGLDLEGLDALLARAAHARDAPPDGSLEALAFRAFGHHAPPAGADWPVAAFTALVDCAGGEGSGFRLRADPVHLRADIADLVLFGAAGIDLSPDEADALARVVNRALGPHGPCIDAAHPHRWYVALDAPERVATTPVSLAAGAGVSAAMPWGPDAPRWHRWMNEVQMALHDCAVNDERERRGVAPVNSVWPWGGGALPPATAAPPPFVQAWSDDVLVHGLARRAGAGHGAMPAGAREWLDGEPRAGRHLAVFDDLHPAMRRADVDAWRTGLERLSRSWAEPLLGALDGGAVARVALHDERGNRFTSTRGGRWRWWRREGLAARIARHASRGSAAGVAEASSPWRSGQAPK